MSLLIEPKLYETILENMPIVCCDVVIRNEDTKKYLLVKRGDEPAKDQWWVVGGRLYKNEKPYKCAIRKVKEEVGITKIKRCEYVDIDSTVFETGYHGIPVHSVNLIYLITVSGKPKVNLDKSCSTYDWFTIQDMCKLNLHPYVNSCIKLSYFGLDY